LKDYEALLILNPELAEEELKSLCQDIQDMIKRHKGQVKEAQSWGKKTLAYNIKKRKEGVYYIVEFQSQPADIKPLASDIKLNESVIRSMITQKSKK
jgi:small subunit ribosomal protein S6